MVETKEMRSTYVSVGIAVSIYAKTSYAACIFGKIMITECSLSVMMHTSRLMEDLSVEFVTWTL
jgi:hypothetical protein